MRAGSLRAFVALVPLMGALNGCAQTRQLDGWLSQSEPRTWAAHTVEVAAATVASDIITDNPWWGYTFMLGAQVGWEVQEARLTDWDVPWWGTAGDLVLPAVTGFVIGKLLNRRKSKDGRAEPVFEDGEVDPETSTDAEAEQTGPDDGRGEARDDASLRAGNRASTQGAGSLFAVRPSPLLSGACTPALSDWPRLGRAAPAPNILTRCPTLWDQTQP